MPHQEALFYRHSIFDVIAHQVEALKNHVRSLPDSEIKDDEETLINGLVEQFGLTVPVLLEDRIEASEKTVQVDVSRDPNRMIFDRSRPFFIPGTEVTIHIPFTGEAILFEVRPTTFTTLLPRGEVRGEELLFVFTMVEGSRDIKPQFEEALRNVKQYLDWLRPSAEDLKGQLRNAAASEIQRRKQQMESGKQALSSLGIKMREKPKDAPPVPASAPPRAPASVKETHDEWDFFISHATEDKEAIARPLAEALRQKGFKVWYDNFSLTVGDSLRVSIDRGLARSRFGIVILSKPFFGKHWPERELNGLATREVNGAKVILPVWHGVTFEEVRGYSPTLADRVAVNTNGGLDEVIEELLRVM